MLKWCAAQQTRYDVRIALEPPRMALQAHAGLTLCTLAAPTPDSPTAPLARYLHTPARIAAMHQTRSSPARFLHTADTVSHTLFRRAMRPVQAPASPAPTYPSAPLLRPACSAILAPCNPVLVASRLCTSHAPRTELHRPRHGPAAYARTMPRGHPGTLGQPGPRQAKTPVLLRGPGLGS